ncbi:hypothetical protein IQ251_15680 [Saccharopolyspora sp. HNM0983]|uniref:PPE family protein n=1 Tax=Saccharopolyspora montiporae TaxID=2781240 RepID=A0A929FYK0_9PSEU|nr:hypothetical protein [Saccharopolyspora sp. HNM0983]MBE9375891.1 hypothetical protein [Saccharopolyspora sp. HNM0983]
MTNDFEATHAVDIASAGVQELAAAATSALGQAGPVGELAQPVVDALRNVWEGYFGSPIPPDSTNWNAYSHEQLHQMLWDNADVDDMSARATELGRHSTELTDHADSMRHQRSAMQANWHSSASELASNRLGMLEERTTDVSSRAGTAQQATQDAGDALSVARNAMPPPPGDPIGPAVSSAAAGAGAGAVVGGVLGAGAGGVGAGPGAAMGAAVGAVAAGGGSLFLADANAAEKKAQAVHVMQRYEAALSNSSHALAPGGARPPGDGAPAATTAAGMAGGAGGAAGGGGAPWGQLIGADHPGERGGVPGRGGVVPAFAARAGGGTGMVQGGAPMGRRGEDEEEVVHENRLPTVDQDLFGDEGPASVPVIGQ